MIRIECEECAGVFLVEELDWVSNSSEYNITHCIYCGEEEIFEEEMKEFFD